MKTELKALYLKDKKLAIEAAKLLGEQAFQNGKKALPYTDKELMTILKNRQVDEGLPLLKAWEKGWHGANQASYAGYFCSSFEFSTLIKALSVKHPVLARKVYALNMFKSFLKQTAKDYDMKLHEVERIAKKYPNTKEFYERLEEFIKIRKNQ